NDASVTAARTYTLTPSGMTAPRPMTFTNCGSVTLDAGAASDTINVTGTPANVGVTVNGNAGNDTINIGGGRFANLATDLSVNGGAGTDVVRYLDDSSTSLDSATLTAAALLTGGRALSYAAVEQLAINTGPGGSILSLNAIVVPTTVNGGTGDDTINVGGGSLKNNLATNCVVNGGAGTDAMNLLGQNDSAKNSYTFTSVT